MKSLIIYSSISGNTKKIAYAMADELEDCELMDIKEFHSSLIKNFDVFYLGYWVDKGDCDSMTLEVMKSLQGRRVILFGTLGAAENTLYYRMIKERVEGHLSTASILGHFLCQGKVKDSLILRYQKMLEKDPDNEDIVAQISNYENGRTHPDEDDLAAARLFASSFE